MSDDQTPGDDRTPFRSGAVRPVECLSGGWELIKSNYWLFLGITLVGCLIAGVAPLGILAGPMMCGIYICLFRHRRRREVKFDMLFRGFEYFVPSLIATLIMIIPMLVIMVPAYAIFFAAMFASMPQPGPQGGPAAPVGGGSFLVAYGLFMLVIIAVSIAVSVLFFFTYPLIVDRKLSGPQAVGTSLRAARANFGGVLGLVLLTTLLDLAGQLACCVGVFFVLPVHFAAVAVAYRQVFPEEDEPVADDERRDYSDRPDDRP